MTGRLLASLGMMAVLAGPASAGTVPTHQTFALTNLGVAVDLPSDWGKDLPPDAGWSWQAMAPGQTAHLYVSVVKTKKAFASIASAYVAGIRQAIARSDAASTVTAKPVRVGPVAGMKIRARYRAPSANALLDHVVADIYIFEHAGKLYVFDYSTTTSWLPKVQHAFDDSIRSVVFPNAA